MALHGKKTLDSIQSGIDNLTPFNAGNVRGQVGAGGPGRMPEPFAQQYRDEARRGAVAYTVYSYATPIAWKTIDGRWVQPPAKYSVTTTGHQSRVAVAISNPSFYSASRW